MPRMDSQARAVGRPPKYSDHLAQSVLWQIASGSALRDINSVEHGVSYLTVMHWSQQKPEFAQQLARAREIHSHVLAAEILSIADDESGDLTPEGHPNNAKVQRDRLRTDKRQWLAAKYNPAVYGDKTIHTGPDGMSAIQVQHAYDASLLQPEELTELRRLLRKMRGATLDME